MKYKPGEQYIIGDNVEAMKVIVDAGVLSLMKPKGTANTAYHCFEKEHHWCMASNHIGHELEKDNGYMAMMIPKTKMDKTQAATFFANCIHENSEAITFGWETVAPLNSN